jgi:hypothetical protein
LKFVETLSSLLSGALTFVGVGGLLGLNSNGKATRPDELVTAKIVRDSTGGNANIVADLSTGAQEVDRELKRVCEEAIEWCRDRATESLRAFTDRAVRYVNAKHNNSSAPDLSSQTWATSETVQSIAERFEQECQQTVAKWISDLKLYLQDEATVRVLLPPLQVSIS